MPSVMSRYAEGSRHSRRSAEAAPDELRAPVVLMVSGGADSTALLLLAVTSALDISDGRGEARIARERLHVLHVNHGLRGIDAQEDEEFVREMASQFGIPCTIRRANVAAMASSSGDNVENAGREFRYTAASELANQLSEEVGTPRAAARIVTAHTADDRAETFFMNAIRGTGPAGLSSIPRRRNRIVRPLLNYTHSELCELLRMHNIVWREDRTNEDTHFLRAYVRHELMPLVVRRNPHVTSTLASTCDILSDEDAYLTRLAGRTYRELVRRSVRGMVALDANKLGATDVAIARRVVRKAVLDICPSARIEARHITAILRLVAMGEGSTHVSFGVEARVEYGLLFIRKAQQKEAHKGVQVGWLEVPAFGSSTSAGTLLLLNGWKLQAHMSQVPHGSDPAVLARAHGMEWKNRSVLLDAIACGVDPVLGGRLWVDHAVPGDVMCPYGMHGQSKKLSDLLNEAKIPAADRLEVPVVRTAPNGHVVWVAGVRADERACCTPSTEQLLVFIITTICQIPDK